MTPLYLLMMLAMVVMTGSAVICIVLLSKYHKMNQEIGQMKAVFQDFLTLQEKSIEELRADLRRVKASESSTAIRSLEGLAPNEGPGSGHSSSNREYSVDESLEYRESVEVALRKKQVWDLADAGCSPEEIAKKMQLPIGQVDVMLNMRGMALSQGTS